jgi:SpoVK/Ycf46/Vps4 family AAA+-type ATPase
MPGMAVRRTAWAASLGGLPRPVAAEAPDLLARRFRLTPGQIRTACREVEAQLVGEPAGSTVTIEELATACRRQASHELTGLAVKIEPRYEWHDLVLPNDRLALLQEICSQVEQRHRVFSDWGFDRKLSHGKGLSVLFSGPSGTGKTMAAEVMARELRLDIYKVDLSGVVSKYIGETEKNLARIFGHAEDGNAILFFDEADALFGKRTEVSDAHDRYANIETSYLLQKMEEYDGMVILASNLRQNMDDAFVRRLRFIVEFPFPSVQSRREIWRSHLSGDAPRSDGIDFDLLAERFKIAGGNIKNVVLNAAFLAAADGEAIAMDHLLRGMRREFEKIGKLWRDAYGGGN